MKWAFYVFTGLYLIALGLLAVSTFGLFGQPKDPLGAVFLLPLGLPWNLLGDRFAGSSAAFAIAAPSINAALLFWLWRRQGG